MNNPTPAQTNRVQPEAAHTPTPWESEAFNGNIRIFKANAGIAVACGCNGEANAAFIVRACNSHAKLVAALEDTATLAYELMERAAKIDRALIAKDGREPDCELGEVMRLRGQLSKNRAALQSAKE